jgi:hypothetical protein
MKKLLAFFIVLSFLVPAAFAEVTIAGKVNAELNALQVFDHPDSDEDDVFASLGNSGDSGNGVQAEVTFKASTEGDIAGFQLTMRYHVAAESYGVDQVFGWLQPFGNDLLRVEVGKFNQDTLKSKFGDAGFLHAYTHTGIAGDNDIFRRFAGAPNGLAISSAPIENLWIGFGVANFSSENVAHRHRSNSDDGTRSFQTDPGFAGNQWSKFQLAVGYTIPGIGLARLQLLAADPDTHENSYTKGKARGIPYSTFKSTFGTRADKSGWTSWTNMFDQSNQSVGIPTGHLIQAAFNVTAVENLKLDIGFGLPIAYTSRTLLAKLFDATPSVPSGFVGPDVTFQAPMNISLGAEYTLGDLGIWLRTDFFFAGYIDIDLPAPMDKKQNIPVAFDLHIKPYYKLGEIGTFGLDFGLDAYGSVKDEMQDVTLGGGVQNMGFGAWYDKAIAGGNIKIGLGYKLPLDAVDSFTRTKTYGKNQDKTTGVFSIPVMFEFSF